MIDGNGNNARAAIEAELVNEQRAGMMSPQMANEIRQWLAGGTLSNPLLVAWVRRVTPAGATVQGAGQVATPAGGLAAANDNGLGGGGPEAAAALAGLAGTPQAQAARPAPAAPGLPTTGGGNAGALPSAAPGARPNAAQIGAGDAAAAQAGALLNDAAGITSRLAGRAAGVDIDRGGLAAKYFQQASNPVIESLLRLMAYVPGGGGDGNIDPTGVQNVIGQVAKMFTTPGADPYAWAREQAAKIAGDSGFLNDLGAAKADKQENALQALLGFRGAGAGALKASAMDQQYERGMGEFQDREFGLLPGSKFNQYGGNVANFFATPEGRNFASVFGLLPK